jgi:polyphosphate kinase 2
MDKSLPAVSLADFEAGSLHSDPLPKKPYEAELRDLQIELGKLQSWVKETGDRVVIVFEGRDAAGKGGAIRRFTEYLNPRGGRIAALAKPTDQERGQWYFQRYVTELPTAGEIVFFDRSWYNRAGVEKVLGFCNDDEYKTFIEHVADFEQSLVDDGIRLFKLWFTVSRAEQASRLEARGNDPLTRWKVSPIDALATEKYHEYTVARDAMFKATKHGGVPWTVINSNEKRRARLEAIRTVLHTIPYDHKDNEIARQPDPLVARPLHTLS